MVERPPPPDLPTRPRPWWKTVGWSAVLPPVGIALLVYEAVFDPGPVDPELLVVYVAMMGLHTALGANEKVKRVIERERQR